MELLFFEREKFEQLYNCSFYSVSQIPLETRTHTFWGITFIVAYFFFMTLYSSCLYAMFNTKHRHRASYQLMILLGCIHITGLQVCGLLHGILAIKGAVFCTNPLLTYISGGVAVSTWCGSTLTSMILGFNRCCELYGGTLPKKLFGGKRLYIWMSLPVFYILYCFVFTPPPVFSGPLMALFFNPHLGYFDDPYGSTYHSVVHSTNNIIVCATESILYTILILLYIRATRVGAEEIQRAFKREKRIYIQVILIGLIHFNASFVYLIMQYIPITFSGTLTASILYLMSQGCPGLIYLFVNRTIRNVLLTKIGHRKVAVVNSTGQGSSQNEGRVKPKQTLTFSYVPTEGEAQGVQRQSQGNVMVISGQTVVE